MSKESNSSRLGTTFDRNGLSVLAECALAGTAASELSRLGCVEVLLQLALCDGLHTGCEKRKYAHVENEEGDDHQEGETTHAVECDPQRLGGASLKRRRTSYKARPDASKENRKSPKKGKHTGEPLVEQAGSESLLPSPVPVAYASKGSKIEKSMLPFKKRPITQHPERTGVCRKTWSAARPNPTRSSDRIQQLALKRRAPPAQDSKPKRGAPSKLNDEADDEAESDEQCAFVASAGDGGDDDRNNARYAGHKEDGDYTPRSPASRTDRKRRRSSPRASTTRKRTKFDENWDAKYARLVAYAEQYGNALVTQKWVEPDGLCLGKWASNQRARQAEGKLTPDRYERLGRIGFWDVTYAGRNRTSSARDQEATR